MEFTVKVITLNLGENKLTQDKWYAELATSWDLVTKKDYDILGVCLQEDWNGNYGHFGNAIAAYLVNEFTVLSEVVEGPPDITQKHFSVKAFLFLRTSKFPNYQSNKHKICLNTKLGFCSKGTAGVSFILQNISTNEPFEFILMSSHFPIDTKVADLGYDKRLEAINTSFYGVYDKLSRNDISKKVSIWAGDLNFRDDTPVSSGVIVPDQLAFAGRSGVFRGFQEVTPMFPATCKLETCHGNDCPVCRSQPGNPNCYKTKTKKGIRNPSHCDRILYKVEGNVKLIAGDYKSWGEKSNAVQHSDHNLVYGKFTIII